MRPRPRPAADLTDQDLSEPQSPCVGLCQLDVAQICLGCGRHIDEVIEWSFVEDARKREILRDARRRLSIIKTGKPPDDETDDSARTQ